MRKTVISYDFVLFCFFAYRRLLLEAPCLGESLVSPVFPSVSDGHRVTFLSSLQAEGPSLATFFVVFGPICVLRGGK